ncbi:MAG: hypothetical protein MZV63_48595 [Marinilabiliales bacterium]|nr:hypothetical protein [Marinilabiliales bacterium]
MMKQHGLFLAFIGLEDGTDEGLARLNKGMTVSKNIEAVDILKNLDIGFDYGFLLFQPESTFKSLKENLEFLGTICGAGYTPFTVFKLLPCFQTRVERELREQGRIKGRPGYLDYDFMNAALDSCYKTVLACFASWMWSAEGMANLAKHARNYFAVNDHFGKSDASVKRRKEQFREILAESNHWMIGTMKSLFDLYESGSYMKEGALFNRDDHLRGEGKASHLLSGGQRVLHAWELNREETQKYSAIC